MILIFSIADSPRLQYIVEVLFGNLLGQEYELKIVTDDFDPSTALASGQPTFLYGFTFPGFPSIPSEGLLFEGDIKELEPQKIAAELFTLKFSKTSWEAYTVDFDLFSAAFYLVTEYASYTDKSFDVHGRYTDGASGTYSIAPVLDIYAGWIWDKLSGAFPSLTKKEKPFSFEITFDIDSPYLFKHLGMVTTMGSIAKKLLKFRIKDLLRQFSVLAGKPDPYDTSSYILQKVPHQNLVFFWLIDRKSKFDGRHTYKNAAYRKLIKQISDQDIAIGIHPSYSAYLNPQVIKDETDRLSEIIGKPVFRSRMHFLKYRLPDTFQYLIQAGITDDYTLCPVNSIGFRNCISVPFKWFDLSKNISTGLILHPTMVMDRSLQKFMHLSPIEAWLEIKKIIDITHLHQGKFTILFHNNALSEMAEWVEWRPVFEKTISYLNELQYQASDNRP